MSGGARRAAALLAALLLVALVTPALAQRLNPTGRTVDIAVPVRERDGGFYLGEVILRIGADDALSLDGERFLEVVSPILSEEGRERLRAQFDPQGRLDPERIAAAGLEFEYDPFLIEIRVGIPAEARGRQELSARALRRRAPAPPTHEPARFAAQLNIAAQTEYVHESTGGEGLVLPQLGLDGAVRTLGVTLETEATVDFEEGDADRNLSRLVYDDLGRVVRFVAGDLRPSVTGFQGSDRLAGVSVERRYSILQPGRFTRPTGRRSFVLQRPSDVDLYVNGQLVRRFRLQPGPYDIRDFPLTIGANEVRLEIRDDAGRLEVLTFDLFFDNELLEPGLDEFFLAAGVEAPTDGGEPDYSDDPAVTGFYRRGITESLTLGANLQADRQVRVAGVEAVAATRIGNFGLDVAVSQHDDAGVGAAAELDWQIFLGREPGATPRSLSLSATATSDDFAALGDEEADNPFALELRAAYAQPLPWDLRGSVNAEYGFGRGRTDDRRSVGIGLSRSFGRWSASLDADWQDGTGEPGFGVFLSVNYRLGVDDRLAASWDSRAERVRASWAHAGGGGIGSLSWDAEVTRDPDGTSLSGGVLYRAARADIDLSHDVRMTSLDDGIDDQRTSLRLDTALVFADGSLAVSRRVSNAFAILVPHPTLGDRRIFVDPGPEGDRGASGILGPAVAPDLGAYASRRVTYDVEDLPPGYDLGTGAFELFPPYRGGYRLVVGSAYNVSVLGTMLDRKGEPVALVAGQAFEVAKPERAPVTVFTNSAGRFGALGLAPGRWRIVMNTTPRLVYEIDIPEDATGLVRLGELRPTAVENGS